MESNTRVRIGDSDQRWARFAHSLVARSAFREAQVRSPALARFGDLLALVRFMRRPGPAAQKDGVLYAVLLWARTDPIGAEVALELVRPGLLNLIRRLTRGARNHEELRRTLLASVWEGIRSYPLERRPRRIAANLLLDALHGTLVQVGADSAWHGRLTPMSVGVDRSREEVDSDVDALLERAVEAGAITTAEAELVLRTRIDGVPLAAAASEVGVSYNTLKLRRQRAERRLLVFLGFRPVPRGPQKRPSSFARVAGAGSNGPDG